MSNGAAPDLRAGAAPCATGQAEILPYGLRQLVLTPYLDAQGTCLANTSYPLPVAMTLGFSESEQYDELRGDDILVAVHGRGPQVDWSLEAGGMNMTCWSLLSGGQVIEEGVTPTRVTRMIKSADDLRPYVRIDGRAISDSGGNLKTRIYRAKANGRLQADLRNGAFQTSRIDGVGLPMVGDGGRWLYEFIHEETDSSIPGTPPPNPLPSPTNLYAINIVATSLTLTWDQVGVFGQTPGDCYQVYESIDNGVTFTPIAGPPGQPTTNSANVATLTTKTTYWFQVTYCQGGVPPTGQEGDPSKAVIVTTP
jgi:hypothetical protein